MKKVALGVFVLFIAYTWVFGQKPDIVAAEFTPYGKSSFLMESGQVQFAVPVFKMEKNGLFISPEYKFVRSQAVNGMEAGFYQQLSVRWFWQYKLNDIWKIQWIGMPTVTSPFETQPSFLFNTMLRTAYKTGQFQCFLGLAYSYRYDNNIFTPVAGFSWTSVDGWNISARVPVNIKIQRRINPFWNLGLELRGNGISSTTTNTGLSDFLWIHEKNMLLFSDIKIYKNWWFTGSIGYAVERTLKTYAMPEKQLWTVKLNIGEPGVNPLMEYRENGFLAKLGIKFKLL
ncbi:MAG: DUF6268 family outer membrane beta-barrel protein [Paludibacter sp.]|nr:DUF6268 family outer membrane beta-barrel protein [Paludibacter sp.]